MKELIKVVKNENGDEVVNARDLHRGVVKEAKVVRLVKIFLTG